MNNMTRIFVTEKSNIQDNITNGIINECDLVITSDTHELIYITDEKSEINLTVEDDSGEVKAAIRQLQGQVSDIVSDQDALSDRQDQMQAQLDTVEQNVQADWAETNTQSDAYILHKPLIPTETAHLGIGYGVCSTASNLAAKTVNITGFELKTGGMVAITFRNGFNQGNTLEISGTGAKYIYQSGVSIGNDVIKTGITCLLVYDGIQWNLLTTDRPLIAYIEGIVGTTQRYFTIGTSDGSIYQAVSWNAVGKANGVASLDASGKVPAEQLDLNTGSGITYHICTSGEVTQAGIPNIATPDDSTIYFVSNSSGSGNNLFDEYVYVNNTWEKIGTVSSGSITDNNIHLTATVTMGSGVQVTDEDGNSIDFNGIMQKMGTDLNSLKTPIVKCYIYRNDSPVFVGDIQLAFVVTNGGGLISFQGSALLHIGANDITIGVLSIYQSQQGGAQFNFRTIDTTDGGI